MPPRTDKKFHTQCQEEVYREVKTYLDELVEEHFDDADHCDFYLKYGSTVLEISIEAFEEDDAVIKILAFCVQGVEPTFELTQELLMLNSDLPLGAFSLVAGDIFLSHSFLGRRLRPEQLIASLESVASISDEYDEKLVSRYGGETALERLRSVEARHHSAAAKAHNN
jgi:predicted dehydrogenase